VICYNKGSGLCRSSALLALYSNVPDYIVGRFPAWARNKKIDPRYFFSEPRPPWVSKEGQGRNEMLRTMLETLDGCFGFEVCMAVLRRGSNVRKLGELVVEVDAYVSD
jgi:hypothetical protein